MNPKASPRLRRALSRGDVRAGLSLRIAELRRARKVTQAALARRLKTTQQAVSDIETLQRANITLGTLQRIARALRTRLVVELR